MEYPEAYQTLANSLGISVEIVIIILAIVSIWTLVWKGLALWKSAKKGSKPWFIAFVILNGLTLGILEILYIYVFSKMKPIKFSKQEKHIKVKKKR